MKHADMAIKNVLIRLDCKLWIPKFAIQSKLQLVLDLKSEISIPNVHGRKHAADRS